MNKLSDEKYPSSKFDWLMISRLQSGYKQVFAM